MLVILGFWNFLSGVGKATSQNAWYMDRAVLCVVWRPIPAASTSGCTTRGTPPPSTPSPAGSTPTPARWTWTTRTTGSQHWPWRINARFCTRAFSLYSSSIASPWCQILFLTMIIIQLVLLFGQQKCCVILDVSADIVASHPHYILFVHVEPDNAVRQETTSCEQETHTHTQTRGIFVPQFLLLIC